MAKAYSFVGETEKALSTFDEIVRRYPQMEYIDEVQFRRGEILFVYRDYPMSEQAYGAVTSIKFDGCYYRHDIARRILIALPGN